MRILLVPFALVGIAAVAFVSTGVLTIAVDKMRQEHVSSSEFLIGMVLAGAPLCVLLGREWRRAAAARKAGRGTSQYVVTYVLSALGALSMAGSVMALPKFLAFKCKSRTTEATAAMKAISTAQQSHHDAFGTYLNLADLTSFGGLDPRAVNGTRFYTYSVTASKDAFAAVASAPPGRLMPTGAADIWTISHTSPSAQHVSDGCE